jgi:glycosyltransferase involved in cell wall biosynthesis
MRIGVLALLEAASITGTAKAVLEFGREAATTHSAAPQMDLSVAIFARGTQQPGGALTAALDEALIRFHVVREKQRFDRSVLAQLRELIAREKADVLWSNSVKSHFLIRAASLSAGRKWLAYHHGYTTTNLKMRAYNQLDRWSLRAADRVVTVCRPFARDMMRRGVREERIRVQHMPIRPFDVLECECRRLRHEMRLGDNEKVVLSVGRLSHEKGHINLIRAFAHLRAAGETSSRLILVGDGPERKSLEEVSAANGLEQAVIFAGHQDDVKPFYGIADVFVLPSYTEGSPNVLLEAMAARVPIVATDVGGVSELADNGRSALLVRAGQPDEIAAAIVRLQADDPLRTRLTEGGCEVVGRHTPDAYYRALSSMIAELMGDETGSG